MSGLGEYQRVLRDLTDRHDFELGKRIFRAYHQHQLIAENRLYFQAGRLDGQGQNTNFHRAIFQLFDDLIAEISVDADLYRRITAAILSKNLWQNVQTRSLVGSDPQRSSRSPLMVGHRGQRLFAKVLHPFGVFVEDLARRRQFDGLARTVQQAVSIFLFELTYLRADRRLRAKNLLASAGETTLAGHFQKRDELIEVHGMSEIIAKSFIVLCTPRGGINLRLACSAGQD